jgi:hypothetical protein
MKSFREKHPGLNEEQLQIKYKIWQREKERAKLLEEAENKKKYKDPFSKKNEDGEEGSYDGSLDVDYAHGGVVSDASILGAEVSFMYSQISGGITKTTFSDSAGRFIIPRSFGEGAISVRGGIDTIIGLPYTSHLLMDGIFFHSYRAITPLTHIANHIWNSTPTRMPREAMSSVIDYIFDFMGVPHSNLNIDSMFNDDHVKLTMEGLQGAKEIQAINTLIEVHADLISGLKANNQWEFEGIKIQTYREIGDALLTRVNGQEMSNYFQNVFKFHMSGQEKIHDNCCLSLLERASYEIKQSLSNDKLESTAKIQAVNYMVKNEWSQKAIEMTQDAKITEKKLWNGIENQNTEEVIPLINLPS